MEHYHNISLTPVQKRAVFKLAVDIAKADRQIHGDEVSLLNSLQEQLGIANDEVDLVHYMSLQEAMNALQSVDGPIRESIVASLEKMVGVDVDVDKREQLLYGSIKIVLSRESCAWASIVSATGVDSECSSEQIVYLEKSTCESAREILDDRFENLLISKALNDVGLQFFYLPQVKQKIDVGLLRRSMKYILPSNELAIDDDIEASLAKTSLVAFFNAFCTSYGITPGQVDYTAFLALKIQESEILDDDGKLSRCLDFLCIDVTSEIKKRITHFVTQIEAPNSILSYDGYYRLLYDYLSAATSTVSSVVIDRKFDFYLKDINNLKLKFDSAPQAKTLFLLLLRYGVRGVSQDCFENAKQWLENTKETISAEKWDYAHFCGILLRENTEWSKLIYNLFVIYNTVSTKSTSDLSFLNYISTIIRQRSALKNYVNHAFMSAQRLQNKENYCINYNKEYKSYYLSVDVSLFLIEDADCCVKPFKESQLWNSLTI